MTRNPSQLVFAGASVLILAIALIAPVYLYMHINSAKAYIDEVQSNLSAQAQLERTDSLTRQALIDTQKERDQLDALAVSKDGAANFISAIENEGRSVGIKLEVGNVLITSKEGLFDTLSLNLQATGDFTSLSRFLKLIETIAYASSIKSVVIERKDEKSGLWTLTAAVSVPIHK